MVIDNTTLARAISLMHHLLKGPLRYGFVCRYLADENKIETVFGEHQSYNTSFFLRGSAMIAITIVAPFAYSWSLMSYPCNLESVRIGNNQTTSQLTQCQVQDWIRSPYSLLLAPGVLFCAAIGASLIQCLAGRKGYIVVLYLYRLQDFISNRMWKLKYHKYPHVQGLVAGTYYLLIVEMAVISAGLQSGVAMLVGYGVAELLLQLANIILAPSDMAIAIIDGELEHWTKRASAKFLLKRLSTLSAEACAICGDEIEALKAAMVEPGPMRDLLNDVNENVFYLWGTAGRWKKKKAIWSGMQMQHVYCSETDSALNVQEGNMSKSTSNKVSPVDTGQPCLPTPH